MCIKRDNNRRIYGKVIFDDFIEGGFTFTGPEFINAEPSCPTVTTVFDGTVGGTVREISKQVLSGRLDSIAPSETA